MTDNNTTQQQQNIKRGGIKMRSPDIEMAVRLYYEKPEITNADIKELFSTGETQTIKIKKAVKEEMAKRGVKSWLPHSVNTEIAYEVWGIDIDNFEKRLKKLRTLYGKDVRNDSRTRDNQMCRNGSAFGGACNVCSIQVVCKRKRNCLRGSRGEH